MDTNTDQSEFVCTEGLKGRVRREIACIPGNSVHSGRSVYFSALAEVAEVAECQRAKKVSIAWVHSVGAYFRSVGGHLGTACRDHRITLPRIPASVSHCNLRRSPAFRVQPPPGDLSCHRLPALTQRPCCPSFHQQARNRVDSLH